ncbi:MAG: acetyl-CoA carboxylase biotin carboxylase subunit [Pseudomonadota bacterium]
MLQKVLVANRGEIACRIMRTARAMGIGTVAVYSDADAKSLHVAMADEAVHIGASTASESYLNIEKIVGAAQATGADCIHPGYGFLAENAEFADACVAAGIKFIGPSSDAMRALGGKAQAKEIAIGADVPVVPGYQGDAQDTATLQDQANSVGYPVMIKAVSGGGGRGMRLVTDASDFAESLESAQREAQAAFGDARVLIEKQVVAPRHIEVQVFGDSHGNVVHLYERDCTLQRRNQKVVEEAPAPGMSDELRRNMTSAAVRLAESVGYEGAGTVEFLVEGSRLSGDANWYFIEMNTRLQVEHPVTEEITGLDLVEWQFRVAAGEELPQQQDDIAFGGHAIEVRLCAEDPARDFAPSLGTIHEFDILEDEGLRIESGVDGGSSISPFYDSLIAKIIRVGTDRDEAIAELAADLEDAEVLGLKTNLGFLHALLSDEDVIGGDFSTGLIGERLDDLVQREPDPRAVVAGVRALLASEFDKFPNSEQFDPWETMDGFQLGGTRRVERKVQVDDQLQTVGLIWGDRSLSIAVDGMEPQLIGSLTPDDEVFDNDGGLAPLAVTEAGQAHVLCDMQHITVSWPVHDISAVDDEDAADAVRAPINGRVAKLFVEEGAQVAEGDSIAVVEAMKMEHVLSSPRAGVIGEIRVTVDAQVSQGAVIASLVAEEAA